MHFDVVHAADPRFSGGTSSALRSEIKAAMRYGVSCALLPFIGTPGKLVGAFEPRVAQLLDTLQMPWLTGDEPASCDILFAHHPQVFATMPARAVRLKPARVVCVAHHPPFDGTWTPQYDYDVVLRNLERLFAAPVSFAPVGPNVRRQFEALTAAPPLLRQDMTLMVDMDEWPVRDRPAPSRTAVIGRHSRPDRLKWPDSQRELLAAYPDARHLGIRALGGVPPEILPWLGSNWKLAPFAVGTVPQFLNQLDFYVYYHSRRWVEAFGLSIAEAMASGLVTVLDPAYEAVFDDGAIYADLDGCAGLVDRLLASPEKFAKQSAMARELVARRFSIETYPARMRALCNELDVAVAQPLRKRHKTASLPVKRNGQKSGNDRRRIGTRRRILFVATNGIGLGHITRLMAIAERLSGDVEPIFFTRSAGSALIGERGHATDYVPWAVKMGVTDASWNNAYQQELLAAIECMDIDAVVFDGTYPFPGLLRVAAARPDLNWIWVRRALWVPGQKLEESLQHSFDMVIEPGELAHDEDHGPTREMKGPIVSVAPILMNAPSSTLTRDEAAARLGTDPSRLTAAVQLGSQSNFDYEDLPQHVVDALLARGVQVVRVANPLAAPTLDDRTDVLRRTVYPLAPCFGAIDLMVTNASYNSFHECIYGCMPTIFVPNEAPEMDDQHLRATYAHAAGLALRLRFSEIGRIDATIATALSQEFRQDIARRGARLVYEDGARQAATAIEQLVFSVKANTPLQRSLARV